jgi:hypothetical protein
VWDSKIIANWSLEKSKIELKKQGLCLPNIP